jgi:two-component system response regulator
MTTEAFELSPIHSTLHVVSDGEQAMRFLRRAGEFTGAPRPGLILLDLNLPRRNGLEVLAELKADPDLLTIPVVIFSTSPGRDGHRGQLPVARQRIHHQAGEPRSVHRGDPAG